MDLVLELLGSVTPASAKLAADLLVPDLFAGSSPQQKHKLKTRISALLKSSGPPRAVGAVLARRALVDWSIVKSHGATWAPILLHILELPDRVCWGPAIRTLAFLYTQVHGKSDLSRETGGAKIGEFMKRLVKVLPHTEASLFAAVTRMLRLYPTPCRPYLNKLAPILDVPGGEEALASLCLAEKAGADIWQQRVAEILAQLEEAANTDAADLVRGHQLAKLREYVLVAAEVKARIPAARLLRVLNSMLKSYRPLPTAQALSFMLATRAPLETLYIQSFDMCVYSLVDCVDLGNRVAAAVAAFMAWELRSTGWASENYSQVLTRLTKKLLAISKKHLEATGAEGLADYVQNPAGFKRETFTARDTAALSQYFSAVVLCVPTIPQSVRTQIDYYLLANGSADDVVKATLYAGRYSILPLTIHQRLSNLDGLEALVHPRFPPLNISQHALQMAHGEGQPEEEAIQGNNTQDTAGAMRPDDFEDAQAGSALSTTAISVDENGSTEISETLEEETEAALPLIPESAKPVHRRVLEDVPPEKRQKLSEPETEAVVQTSTTVNENAENNDDDSEDELVIPTLTMDSD